MRARQTSAMRYRSPGSIPTAIALLILVPILCCVAGLITTKESAPAEAKTEQHIETASVQFSEAIERHVTTMEEEIRCWMITQTARRR